MAKLRHVAITVPDPEETATFYEKSFEMERVYESKFGVLLSDGTVSLAILNFPDDKTAGDERGKDFFGLHHIGFVVDDLEKAGKTVTDNGANYHMRLPGRQHSDTEQKYRDPNGVVFDLVNETYATKVWKAKQ
jgi:methylmalonyl-CoA/ethylmalonyl-CoA epimerase